MKSILRAVSPVSGRILIGNIDLATIDENAIRKYVGLLSRCPVIFKGSLLSNIDPEGVLPEKEVENENYLSVMFESNIWQTARIARHCARHSYAQAMVMRMPHSNYWGTASREKGVTSPLSNI